LVAVETQRLVNYFSLSKKICVFSRWRRAGHCRMHRKKKKDNESGKVELLSAAATTEVAIKKVAIEPLNRAFESSL